MANPPNQGNLTLRGTFARDDDGIPVTYLGLTTVNSKTLVGNGATVAVPLFSVTGSVMINAIYGVVTTVLGANNTAAYWRLNDQTAQVSITASSGTTLSAAAVGGTIVKKGLAAAALTFLDAAAGRVSEPTTLETPYFSPFTVVQKTGGVATNIEFVYTTSDTPTSGTIAFAVSWVPLTLGSGIATL